MTEPVGDGPAPTFLRSIGWRGRRRAEPRLTIALAGAGCALAVLGVLLVAGDSGSNGGSFNRLPGIFLTALVVAVGAFTVHLARTGPLATAGTVAAVLGIPTFLFFLTFDEDGSRPLPSAVVIVSTLLWVGGYLFGPTKGRPIFLAAALLGGWATLLEITVDGGFIAAIGIIPSGLFGFFFFGGFMLEDGDGFSYYDGGPDFTTVGLLSIGVGIAYVLLSRHLDRKGFNGTSAPFVAIAIVALVQGVSAMIFELEVMGTGVLAAAVGVGLAVHGATAGRRATTWFGAGATVVGLAMVFGDMADGPGVGGLLFIGAGVGLVAAAHALVNVLDEPDEMVLTEGVQPLRRPAITIVPPSDPSV